MHMGFVETEEKKYHKLKDKIAKIVCALLISHEKFAIRTVIFLELSAVRGLPYRTARMSFESEAVRTLFFS